MYILNEIKKDSLNYLELKDFKGEIKAVICLSEGGRLDQLMIDAIDIIKPTNSSAYNVNYASAVLFPFANRIKNGAYTFEESSYQLDCNESERNNAIHGLVYNKNFELVDKDLTKEFGLVTLSYSSEGHSQGFPFKYKIELTYKLTKKGVSLKVNVLNKDEKVFPFTLGWHPYFETKNLYNSQLNFKSNTQFLIDKQFIPFEKADFNQIMPFQLKDTMLDDGYQLENNQIEFLSPEYQLTLNSTASENYLQLYTPSGLSCIAIEPMTGVADSFNNKTGLQTLKPNTSYKVVWSVEIKNLQVNNK